MFCKTGVRTDAHSAILPSSVCTRREIVPRVSVFEVCIEDEGGKGVEQ